MLLIPGECDSDTLFSRVKGFLKVTKEHAENSPLMTHAPFEKKAAFKLPLTRQESPLVHISREIVHILESDKYCR